jgi:gliding motility-associated-like protein
MPIGARLRMGKKYHCFLMCIIILMQVSSIAQSKIIHYTHDTTHSRTNVLAPNCGMDIMLYRLRKDPAYRARENKMNGEIADFAAGVKDTAITTLPVVVHIINDNADSISDATIITGIQLLNDAFSKSGVYAASAGADTKIRFCLAKKDPDGGITTGITRTTSYLSDHLNKINEDAQMKNLIQWDPLRYINIWLVTSIEGEAYASFSCGNWIRLTDGGYAVMPPGGDALDGIVIPYFGAVLAHEMGHYLGLYHTFQGGCTNNNCLLDGDMVCDTPPDNSVMPSVSCSNPENSCNTDTLSNYSNGFFHTDVPDQIANFMDYGNTACSNEFTQGQADRMKATIMTQRSGLLQDECDAPCTDSIVASFTRDIAYSVTGNTINFTNTSSGATNFQWLVNDVVVSNTLNFSYAFSVAGKIKVTLKAFSADGCFAAYTDYIITSCGVDARFYTNKDAIASKAGVYTDSIIFTNDSYNAASYQWLISNDQGMAQQVVSTATNLTYVFPTPGNYMIRLVAANGACSDTTDAYPIMVQDPTANGVPFNVKVLCHNANQVQVTFCIEDFGFAPLPAGTPVSFYDANPLSPGAHKLSPTFYLPQPVPGMCASCFTQILNVQYHGLEQIYVAFNDSGKTVPVVLPNTNLIESNYADNFASSQTINTDISASVCHGQSYGGHSSSGTYTDTLTSIISGCDSIRILHLTVLPFIKSTVTTSICDGQNYYGHTTTGTYIDTITTAKGCDSIRTLNLTLKNKSYSTANITICEGQSYFAGGSLQTSSGIYVDTLTNMAGCDSIVTIGLTVNPSPKPDLGEDRGICFGTSLILNPGNFNNYLWQDGSTGGTYIVDTTGRYFVSVTNSFHCSTSDTIMILAIYPLPARFLPDDTSICRESTLQINLPGYNSYAWSTGSSSSSIDIVDTGVYSVTVIDNNGCKGSDSIMISNHTCVSVYIPNSFTPDGNGLNDIFRPIFPSPVSDYHIEIFNRWGQRVFESNNNIQGWDGSYQSKEQPLGVYVYVVTFKNVDDIPEKRSGTVTLLR